MNSDALQLAHAQVVASRLCRLCGAAYSVSQAELDVLHELAERNAWPSIWAPTRCRACRRYQREKRHAEGIARA